MEANRMAPAQWMGAFAAGVVIHRFVGLIAPMWLLAGIFTSVILFWRTSLNWYVRLIVAALAGFAWANWQGADLLDSTIHTSLEKQDLIVQGVVTGVPTKKDRYTRFDFKVNSIVQTGHPDRQIHPAPKKIRLKTYHDLDAIKPDQRWILVARLKQARGLHNPGSQFDYETWLFANRIRATGYVRESPRNRKLDLEDPGFSVSGLRAEIEENMEQRFGDHPDRGVLSALLVGLRGNMDQGAWSTLRDTGTIHLVAISGLHISLLSGMVIWLVSGAWRLTGTFQNTLCARDAGLVAGLMAALGYALLAGLTIPTQRALIMLFAVALTFLCRRRCALWETLVFALFAVLVFDPLSTLDIGFWLSFGAVAVIAMVLFRGNPGPAGFARKLARAGAQWCHIQLGLGIALAPLLIMIFGQVSLIAPIANLVAVPVVTVFVVPVAMIGLILYLLGFPDFSAFILEVSLQGIAVLMGFLDYLAALDWAVWYPGFRPGWTLLAAVAGLLLVQLGFARYGIFLVAIWLMPVLLFRPERLESGSFMYTLLDVGQGLASVVQTRNHALVYDTGPGYGPGSDAGISIVLPFLRHAGIRRVDTLIVSHEHNDHSGGYRSIAENTEISRVLSGAPDQIHGAKPCHAGQRWQWDGVTFEILWPESVVPSAPLEGNDASCVLRIHVGEQSLLLTGDIEAKAERSLATEFGDKLASQVLQVPHQGSKSSSTPGFLDRVNPAHALVSAGYKNRFGHPHQSVLQRYRSRGTAIWQTPDSGAVSVLFSRSADAGIRIVESRNNTSGYWYN